MSQTPNPNPAPQTPVLPDPEASASVWQRFGSGLLLFSLVFSAILSVSWVSLLPRLTRIQLQGQTVDLSVVIPHEQRLRAQIQEAEAKRDAIVLPVKDRDYDFLKQTASCFPLLHDMRKQMDDVASTLGKDVVLFSSITFDAQGTMLLQGDVRNVGPRSMTLLATLVDALSALPFVASAIPPAFTRQHDPVIGLHSPFSFTLTLKPSDLCPAKP